MLGLLLFVSSILFAVSVGVGLAVWQCRLATRLTVFVALFFLSVLIACWPSFRRDPQTWAFTYGTGVVYMGCASPVLHVLPAVVGYYVTRWIRTRRRATRRMPDKS